MRVILREAERVAPVDVLNTLFWAAKHPGDSAVTRARVAVATAGGRTCGGYKTSSGVAWVRLEKRP